LLSQEHFRYKIKQRERKRRNKNEEKNGEEREKSLRKLLIKSIHGASQVQTIPPLYCVPFDSYQNALLYAIFSVYKKKSFSMETLIVRIVITKWRFFHADAALNEM